MSAIFESETLGPTERLIMLALADHADDAGRCYPSIARLCQRTGLSERAIQTNIRRLSEQGYIRVSAGGGKGNANLYFITANPAADAPRSKCTPAPDAPQTPQQVRPNPAADAPEPSGTIIEPSKEAEDGGAHDDDPAQDETATIAEVIDLICHRLGLAKNGIKPRYWGSAEAAIIVGRWMNDLQLSQEDILKVAVANAETHGSPARGPMILTDHMRAYAGQKQAAPLTPIQPKLTPIEGGQDVQSPRSHRQAASEDRLGRILDAAVRNRAPSR